MLSFGVCDDRKTRIEDIIHILTADWNPIFLNGSDVQIYSQNGSPRIRAGICYYIINTLIVRNI